MPVRRRPTAVGSGRGRIGAAAPNVSAVSGTVFSPANAWVMLTFVNSTRRDRVVIMRADYTVHDIGAYLDRQGIVYEALARAPVSARGYRGHHWHIHEYVEERAAVDVESDTDEDCGSHGMSCSGAGSTAATPLA